MCLCSCTKLHGNNKLAINDNAKQCIYWRWCADSKGVTAIGVSLWYWFWRAGRDRRVTVALLKDFRRVVGLTVGSEDPSVLSTCTSLRSVCVGCSTTADVCVVGNWSSTRGDLCGGAKSGLGVEHRLPVSTTLMHKAEKHVSGIGVS